MARRKRYTVQRRIEVWAETEVLATDFDDAVAQGKELEVTDFVKPANGEYFLDSEWRGGFAVIES